MTRLRDFNQNSILLWWAEETSTGQRDLKNVAINGRTHLIYPDDLTLPKLRRHIQKVLRRRGLLPRNRPPTKADYDLIKQRFLTQWFNQDLQ